MKAAGFEPGWGTVLYWETPLRMEWFIRMVLSWVCVSGTWQRPIIANPELNRISHFDTDKIKQSSSQENKDKTWGGSPYKVCKGDPRKSSEFASWSVETFELLSPPGLLKDEHITLPFPTKVRLFLWKANYVPSARRWTKVRSSLYRVFLL